MKDGRVPGLLAAIAVTVGVAAFALYRWDGWILNFDGSAYLALSSSLRETGTYRFPDGAFATFRGPGFPLFLAIGESIVGASVRHAIWIARSVLVVNAVLVTVIVWRYTKRAVAAAVAGVVTAVMPWPFVSGATGLVPDALAAGFVLAGLAALKSERRSMIAFSGVLLGSAVVTKETAVFGLAVALLVLLYRQVVLRDLAALIGGFVAPVALWWAAALAYAGTAPAPLEPFGAVGGSGLLLVVATGAAWFWTWSGERSRVVDAPSWVIPAALVSLGVVVFVALVVGAGGLPEADDSVLSSTGDALLQELYQGSQWWMVLVVAVVLIGWALTRRSEIAVMGFGLMAVGAGALVYAAVGRFGVRNGVLAAYGLALLVGLAVSVAQQRRPLLQVGVAVAVVAFLVGNIQATAALNERSANDQISEQSFVVESAAAWLADVGPINVATTPMYGAAAAAQVGRDVAMELVPMYVSSSPTWPQQINQFVNWLGQSAAPQPPGEFPLAVAISNNRVTVVDPTVLADALNDVDYVMLTGNARFNASPFDGGVLLPVFDASPTAHRVFSQNNFDAQWIVIYEIQHPFVIPDVPPLYRSSTGEAIDGQPTLDLVEYSELVKALVATQ